MAYAFDSLKVMVSVVLVAGCTGENPLFQIDEGTDTGGGTQQSAGETTSVTPTSEGPTSEGPTSAGSTGGVATSMGPGSDATTGAASSGGEEETSAPETSGTSEPGTASDGSEGSSGMNEGVCGDGVPNEDAGEECDEGQGNGNGGACTTECLLNVCGDGYLGEEEKCDDGAENGQPGKCKEGCLNVCGDGIQDPDEVCDAGAMNGKMHPGCSPDCKAWVEEEQKFRICEASFAIQGDLAYVGKTGIAGADALCQSKCPGLKTRAMIAGEGRVASKLPYAGKEPSWVVAPFTAYYRWQGGPLVFVTGAEGLLGVANGVDAPLLAAMGGQTVWTGLNPDWTTAEQSCMGWTKLDPNNHGMVGNGAALAEGAYIAKEPQQCGSLAAVYCVEYL